MMTIALSAQTVDGPKYNLLCADFSKGEVLLVNKDGSIKHRFKAQQPNDVWSLPNGEVMFTWRRGLKIYDKDAKKIFEWQSSEEKDEIHTCQPLSNGNILIAQNGPSQLIEINRKGEVLKTIPVKTKSNNLHMRFRMCRKLKNGNYLCMISCDNEIRELDSNGKIVRIIKDIDNVKMAKAHAVTRLANGNTLFSTGSGTTAVEVDKDNKVVWKVDKSTFPEIKMGFMTGLNRLPNGNTIICFYQGSHHMIEVSADKKLLWKWRIPGQHTVVSCQILDQQGDATKGTIYK
jgi:hypothetical protein